MATHYQIIRGGGWTYGNTPCENGMVVAERPGNNERLVDSHQMCIWSGPVDGLPHCDLCDCWFISPAMYEGHLNHAHALGLREMKEQRAAKIDVLGKLRTEAEKLGERIAALQADVLDLDKAIAEKEQALAIARGEVTELKPLAKSARVSLG